VITNWWSIVRNYVYFGYRHGLLDATELEVIDRARAFMESVVRDARHHEELGRTEPGHADRARSTSEKAMLEGMRLGRESAATDVESVVLEDHDFRPYLDPAPGQSLRVILVSSGYTPNLTGGISRFISDVAPELARRGHEVRVFARAQDVATVDLEDGVWVHRLVPTATPGLVAETSVWIDSFATAVANELDRIDPWWKPDVMYGSLWDVEMLGAARVHPALPIVPMLATPVAEVAEHEGWLDPAHPFHDGYRQLVLLERELVARSACVHAISEAIVETFQKLYPGALHRDRVEITPIGRADDMDGEPTPLPTQKPCVLFIGRLEPRKGIDVFLRAARQLLADHADLAIVVAGDDSRPGPSGKRYPDEWSASAGRAANRLVFRGAVGDEELSDLIDASTVVVMPSRYESFGLVAVEAMMHGRPVVASNIGGLAEVVADGETGLLVPVNDTEELTRQIARLIDDPQLALAIGNRGRLEFEDRLNAVAAAARLESVLHRALTRVGRPSRGSTT
jgi:glycosyltransferase involved in cell wall biosynthesis